MLIYAYHIFLCLSYLIMVYHCVLEHIQSGLTKSLDLRPRRSVAVSFAPFSSTGPEERPVEIHKDVCCKSGNHDMARHGETERSCPRSLTSSSLGHMSITRSQHTPLTPSSK